MSIETLVSIIPTYSPVEHRPKKKPRQIFFSLSPSFPKSFNFLLVHPAPLGLAWSQGASNIAEENLVTPARWYSAYAWCADAQHQPFVTATRRTRCAYHGVLLTLSTEAATDTPMPPPWFITTALIYCFKGDVVGEESRWMSGSASCTEPLPPARMCPQEVVIGSPTCALMHACRARWPASFQPNAGC